MLGRRQRMISDSELWPIVMCPPLNTKTDRSYSHKELALESQLAKAGKMVSRQMLFWESVYIAFLLVLPA
jgi:hypothetical protein